MYIQKSILRGDADIAVHSAKDTPAKELDSLLRYFLPSKPKEDVLIFREETNFNEEMILGTSSLRRQLQAKQCQSFMATKHPLCHSWTCHL